MRSAGANVFDETVTVTVTAGVPGVAAGVPAAGVVALGTSVGRDVALAVAVGNGVAVEVAVTRTTSGVAVLVAVGSSATMSAGFGSERGIDTRLVTQAGRYATNHQAPRPINATTAITAIQRQGICVAGLDDKSISMGR